MGNMDCPYCLGTGRLLTGDRCFVCNGFKQVDENGRRRGEYVIQRQKQGNFNGYPVKDDWDGECPF